MPSSWVHTGYAQRLHFGVGTIDRIGEILRELGLRRVMVVMSAGRLESDDGRRLVDRAGRAVGSTFAGVRSHVPTDAVQAAILQARRDGVDGIVSYGGGSAVDLAKAVAFFVEQEAGTPGASYTDRPALPHVAVPTTYSGAEVTPGFGMTDERTRTKSGAGSPTTAPVAVIYDPVLTRSTPPKVSAETAMNALAHCVEAVYATTRTPEAEAIALAGARVIASTVPDVIERPSDLDARTDLLSGAALAGRALQNASMGVQHGLAQLIGGRTRIPHGLANAVLLPYSIRYNAEVAGDALARIGDALGDASDPAAAVTRLLERLGLPTRLSEAGVAPDDLDAVARLSQSSPVVRSNPRPVSEDDARALLEAAW